MALSAFAWPASLVVLVAYTAHVVTGAGKEQVSIAASNWVYVGLMGMAAAGLVVGGLRRRTERLPWVLLGLGLASWVGGEVAWAIDQPEAPSYSDILYLGFYPLAYAAIVLLLATRVRLPGVGAALDGAIVMLGSAAVGAAVVVREVSAATGGSVAEVAVVLAYPAADVLLIALVVTTLSTGAWRREPMWLLLALGLAAQAVADSIYAYQAASGTYLDGTALDTLWPIAAFLMLAASRRPVGEPVRRSLEEAPVLTGAAAIAASAILAGGSLGRLDVLTAAFATAAVLGALLRLTLTLRENRHMLQAARHAATTDALTGLANRRLLLERLQQATERPEQTALVLFDLDGFKDYNDAFGHVAGDALLARLGARLRAAAQDAGGEAFRLGGDEFCVLAPLADDLAARLSEALRESGEGFAVEASAGLVEIPGEADDAVQALQVADQRMYREKHGKPRRRSEVYGTLLAVLSEGEPAVYSHARDVSRLAERVACALDLPPAEVASVRRAAELHDIGKIAIPDAILHKPAPLDQQEWAFMRDHTLIGERLVAAAGGLDDVARIVRASHERVDGTGYPDGLAGDRIPLAARIVAACDAFDSMTTDRPYRPAMTVDAARRELVSAAGTQFDPLVVATLERLLAQERTQAA